jgi:hypothetical protein
VPETWTVSIGSVRFEMGAPPAERRAVQVVEREKLERALTDVVVLRRNRREESVEHTTREHVRRSRRHHGVGG